ncbi:hypothetical protein B4123_0922 [Bacillus paralicheniformis]|nr:hypothetical protein B4123_0922 [Bacillus paralicheniformis]
MAKETAALFEHRRDFNDRQTGWKRVKPVLFWKTVPALNC